jgi:hypothetical protein
MILFLILFTHNNLIDDVTIREMYQEATRNEETCETLYELLKNDSSRNLSSSRLAFYGATLTLMANFSKNPVKKMMYGKQADYILDQSVIMDPKNFDARTLRILFNAKAPSILSNNRELKEDLYVFDQLKNDSTNFAKYNKWIISIINDVQTDLVP